MDENYNQKYLNDEDAEFLRGFDWAMEECVDNFFNNDMFELQDEETYLGHILSETLPESMQEQYTMEFRFGGKKDEDRTTLTYADLIRFKILDWLEMERNELIISMIDNMDEWQYLQNKERANGQSKAED